MRKTFIIAEAGVNHNGSIDQAFALIDIASEAGADAVKFQTFNADRLADLTAPKAAYQIRSSSKESSQYEMLKSLEVSPADHLALQVHARSKGIMFLSTAFDVDSLKFLHETMGLPILKISSGDITNGPLLLEFAKTGRNVILSTGMSTLAEIEDALSVIAYGLVGSTQPPSMNHFREIYRTSEAQDMLKDKVTLLHCTSQYPTLCSEVNLGAIDTMRSAFKLPVGYSDHTVGLTISIAAVAMGACVIEKHFTLDKNMDGPDHQASLGPAELTNLVASIRELECAFGSGIKQPSDSEIQMRTIARRGLRAAHDLKQDHAFAPGDISCLRPASTVSPMHYWNVINRKTGKALAKGEAIEH